MLKKVLSFSFFFYPVLIFWGLENFSLNELIFVVVSFIFVRLYFSEKKKRSISTASLMLIFCFLAFYLKNQNLLKLYPVLVSVSFSFIFFTSLRKGKTPLIEYYARKYDQKFSENDVGYTRKLTFFWGAITILNAFTSLYTCFFTSKSVWVFYNSFLSYLILGGFFLSEFIYRKYLRKKKVL